MSVQIDSWTCYPKALYPLDVFARLASRAGVRAHQAR